MRPSLRTFLAILGLSLGLLAPAVALSPSQEVALFSGGSKACSKLVQSCTTGYTYYVNSATGNNSNVGTSFGSPLKDVTSLPSITAGQSVCLEAGSSWRQQLTVANNDVTVGGCGTGSKPILDASDVIANASLTADGSGAYFTASITFIQGGQPAWINVFETGGPGDSSTGQFLANVASQALCDSTPGSYYVPGLTGTNMPTAAAIYIHPTDSSNAITNGYLYEFSNRRGGLYSTGLRTTVANLEGRKNSGNDGAIELEAQGGSYTVNNVIARDGNKHSMFVSSGSSVKNSLFINSYYAGNYGGLLVLFDQVGQNLSSTLINNIFQLDQKVDSLNSISAFISHTGSGTMGPVAENNSWYIAKNEATLSGTGLANVSSHTANGTNGSNVKTLFSPYVNTTINNAHGVTNYGNYSTFAQFGASGITVTFNNPQFCYNSGTINSSNAYYFIAGNVSVVINGGITYIAGSMYYYMGDGGSAPNGINLTVNSHTFDGTQGGSTAYYFTGSGGVFAGGQAGNANSYNTAKITQWLFNNTNKITLAAWQAFVSPQDSAAITTGNGLPACTLPTIPTVN